MERNEIKDLAGNSVVVEGGEGMDERRDEEKGVEGEEGMEKWRLGESGGELRESVGDMEGRRERIGDEVGEAEETDGAALLSAEDESGPVAHRACR